MSDDDLLREELNELMVCLRLVRLEQDRIEKTAAVIEKKLNRKKNNSFSNTNKERSYTDLFVPKIGDHVRITNPRVDQPSEGIVQGFCSDGKLKIGDKKPYVMRLPKNVVHICRQI